MGFIIIEGDNGTGKDTIADALSSMHGFTIISRQKEMIRLEHNARTVAETERTAAFLGYNHACGQAAAAAPNRGCLVRYWISTLAASFADQILPEDEILTMAGECLRDMPAPDLAVQLVCPEAIRVARIMERKIREPDRRDDITTTRSARYRLISGKLLDLSGYPLLRIDTARNTPGQTAAQIATTVGAEDHGR